MQIQVIYFVWKQYTLKYFICLLILWFWLVCAWYKQIFVTDMLDHWFCLFFEQRFPPTDLFVHENILFCMFLYYLYVFKKWNHIVQWSKMFIFDCQICMFLAIHWKTKITMWIHIPLASGIVVSDCCTEYVVQSVYIAVPMFVISAVYLGWVIVCVVAMMMQNCFCLPVRIRKVPFIDWVLTSYCT